MLCFSIGNFIFLLRMGRKNLIIRIVATLIFTAISFLFVHSETNLFDDHTNSCDATDLCLILKKAGNDTQAPTLDFSRILENHSGLLPFNSFSFDPSQEKLPRQCEITPSNRVIIAAPRKDILQI